MMLGRAIWMALLLVTVLLTAGADTPATVPVIDAAFCEKVNLDKFRLIAVQHEGRYKTFDTLARSVLRLVSRDDELVRGVAGRERPLTQDAAFTYLDLMLNPRAYDEVRLVYVKEKPLRDALTQAAHGRVDKATLNAILDDGRVSMAFLELPEVQAKLDELSCDVVRTARKVQHLAAAAGYIEPDRLRQLMRIVPPVSATSVQDRWYSIAEMDSGDHLSGLEPARWQAIASEWAALQRAWLAADAAGVNAALDSLAEGLAKLAPQVYPSPGRLALEHWYYRYNKMMWSWAVYFLAAIFLLMGVIYRWPLANRIGIAFFLLGFLLHTVACGIRWYLAGRIPNTNMFEAVTVAAWFGAAVAIFIELGPVSLRRRPLWKPAVAAAVGGFVVWLGVLVGRGIPLGAWQQWGTAPIVALIIAAVGCMGLLSLAVARRASLARGLPLLAAASVATVALMCGQFLKNSLDSDIGQAMPVLNDLWLYIHVNMIIASYALIGMAFVTAALYLVGRLLTTPLRQAAWPWLAVLIPTALTPLPALAPGITLHTLLAAWAPFLGVLGMFVLAGVMRLLWPDGARRAGLAWRAGADAGSPGLAQVLDGATMLLIELAFVMLWTGIIMGAVWADHSWGRPWGWDPKEVFALNTWIIFLILVHVRLKAQDRELWTSVLTVIGMAVMMFNWVAVNYFIVGLHSYA